MDAYSERTNSPEKTSDRHTPSSTSKTAFTPNILTSSSDPAIKDLPLGTFKPASRTKTGLAPYFAYGRMKAQDTMTTVCRDPYCTGCSVSSHLFGAASVKPMSCPAGCTQCDHAKVPTSVGYMGHNPAAAAYAHAQLAALAAASHLPYSEELLAHLRTHTSGSIETSSALSMLGSPGLSPSHPLLHRTYPTPPLSPLATARYHPYSKPSLLPPSLSSSSLAGFPLSHPGLSPYLSPYSLYGSRLGAAPGMHP
ncbi:hypothetical protein JTB14_015173 [Gonioctena quinquepunctata]|nr:hypothetical protein JTB14_015173 [Gonioctena quinquepunctata]